MHEDLRIVKDRALRRKAKKLIWKKRWHRIFTLFLCLIVAAYAVGGYYAYNYAAKLLESMPELSVDDLKSDESTRIYDTYGNLLTEVGTYYRKNITYDQCPEALIDAFLSIEDSRYFEHYGFDIPRFVKSAVETLRGNTQGGSTFTMQLVKNTYFSVDAGDESTERDATLSYKAQQIVLSMQLEQIDNKKDIFTLYVNS